MNPPPLLTIDLLSYSDSHLSINSQWLQALDDHFNVNLVAEATHVKALEHILARPIKGRQHRRGRFWKLWREALFALTLLRAGRKRVLIMGATGAQLVTLSLFERMVPNRAKSWVVILHSELEGLVGAPGLMKKLAAFAIRKMGFPRHCNAVVLGQHIQENLMQEGVSNPNIHTVEHPLPPEIQCPTMDPPRVPARFSVIGLLRADTKDLSLAGQVAQDPRVRVRMIGRKGPGYTLPSGVEEDVVSSHYTNDWMKARLADTDILLLCPAPGKYRFTALGSVTDSLVYGKPVAWLEHQALQAYECAPIGICAPDVQRLCDKVLTFSAPDTKAIQAWVKGWNTTECNKIIKLLKSDA